MNTRNLRNTGGMGSLEDPVWVLLGPLRCGPEGVPFPADPQFPHSVNEEVGVDDGQNLFQLPNPMVLTFP